jgi:ribulose 1,5-bisphosphate synthetase/thiazole synthase
LTLTLMPGLMFDADAVIPPSLRVNSASQQSQEKLMHQADILIIGGIAGTATACYLAQYDRQVILLEQTACVSLGLLYGATSRRM